MTDSFSYIPPIFVLVFPVAQWFSVSGENLNLGQLRDLLPSTICNDISDKLSFSSLHSFMGNVEFFEQKIGIEEVSTDLKHNYICLIKFITNSSIPFFPGRECVCGPYLNQAISFHQLQVFT